MLDFFAGSGTTGVAAARHGRGFVLVDESRTAVRIMQRRLAAFGVDDAKPAPAPALREE